MTYYLEYLIRGIEDTIPEGAGVEGPGVALSESESLELLTSIEESEELEEEEGMMTFLLFLRLSTALLAGDRVAAGLVVELGAAGAGLGDLLELLSLPEADLLG